MLAGYLGNYSRYEIEKKFLLEAVPSDLPADYKDIHDTYLPNSDLRLRIVKSPLGEILSRKLTQKKRCLEQFATSTITSLYLTENDLSALGNLKGFVLNKWRYTIKIDNHSVAIDVMKGPLMGLVLAEVEFLNDQAMNIFKSPFDD